jgi:hypothetical protein
MAAYSFDAVLIRPEGVGTWTFVDVPPQVSAEFGAKGQTRVKGTINGVPFRSTAMPHGDGRHYVVINKAVRDEAGVTAGDKAAVMLELDTEARVVEIPPDLAQALENNTAAKAAFEKLSYSHKKEFGDWISAAKQAETRARRIEKSQEMLLEGETPKRKKEK